MPLRCRVVIKSGRLTGRRVEGSASDFAPRSRYRHAISTHSGKLDSQCACGTCVGMAPGTLYLGDNLDVLRSDRIPAGSIDLLYLDPPFNSNREYNMLFEENDMSASKAQLRAFEDTWHWDRVAQETYDALTVKGGVSDALANIVQAFCRAFPRSDMAAYLVMMAVRLVEFHRMLKPTGSLYLHCDPTASHYIKLILDAIFGASNFRNEVVWQRSRSQERPEALRAFT